MSGRFPLLCRGLAGHFCTLISSGLGASLLHDSRKTNKNSLLISSVLGTIIKGGTASPTERRTIPAGESRALPAHGTICVTFSPLLNFSPSFCKTSGLN